MIIEDLRTPEEIKATRGFVVASTSYTRSIGNLFSRLDKVAIAAAYKTKHDYKRIAKKFAERDDLRRVRAVDGVERKDGRHYRTKGFDRVIIHGFDAFK